MLAAPATDVGAESKQGSSCFILRLTCLFLWAAVQCRCKAFPRGNVDGREYPSYCPLLVDLCVFLGCVSPLARLRPLLLSGWSRCTFLG
jgi:hypothetical protein